MEVGILEADKEDIVLMGLFAKYLYHRSKADSTADLKVGTHPFGSYFQDGECVNSSFIVIDNSFNDDSSSSFIVLEHTTFIHFLVDSVLIHQERTKVFFINKLA